ncbi:hypothetical protein D3C78_1328130 [compost metagenome]
MARLWAWLADKGTSIRSAPLASARSAPFKLGTKTDTVSPSRRLAWATKASVSANWGSSRAGTNDPTSISRWPAA